VSTELLSYPVLTIAWNGFLATGEDEETLRVCSEDGFESGFYDSLRIIDSSGALFVVRAARKARPATGPLRRILGRGLWRVDLDLAAGDPLDLRDVKIQVIAAIYRNPTRWEEAGTLDETVQAVAEAGTLQAVMGLFSGET
jgi:hypothetical protein